MRIKNKIVSIIIMTIPLLITIGFSAWIIIYEFGFSPEYQTLGVLSDYFDLEQSTTYNTLEQAPVPKDGVTIDLSDATYKYKLDGTSIYQDGKPTDAGIYDVLIAKDDYGQCQIKFTINKKQVKPLTSTILIDYNSSYTSWSSFQSVIYSNVSYVDVNGDAADELSMANCFIQGMHNGLYYYGTVDNSSSYTLGSSIGTDRIIGSTYQAVITMSDGIKDNYEWISNRLIIKYKTAKVSGTCYTIEDAINNTSGTITFEGNLSDTSFVATSFCNLTKAEGNPYSSTTFNLSSRTLIVPYEASTTDHTINTNGTSSGSVYSSLIVPSSVTLNVPNGSTLTAAAFIGFKQPKITISCDRGVIMNYGTINVENGGTIKAYGYIKGTGTINLASGASALDCMTTYDWPGGTAGSSMYSDVMPTNAWSLHNISCDTYINAGATYNGYVHVTIDPKIFSEKALDTTAVIIGSSSSSNCIFKITSGYIKKSTTKASSWEDNDANSLALNTITGLNQIAGQRDVIELYGTCEDGTLNVSISYVLTVTMQSSTSIPAPISYMDVYVKNGSKITLSKSDYMFLPGSKLVIEKGAEMNILADVDVSIVKVSDFSSATGARVFTTYYCVDKNDAVCIVDGTLNVTNGAIGGLIQTTNEGAVLNLGSATSLTSSFRSMQDTNSPYYFTGSCTASGNITGTSGNFEQKMYISYEVSSGVYGWEQATNVTTFTLNFYDYSTKTLLETTTIYVINDSSGNASYVVTGDEYAPEKLHYDFSKWVDSNGNDLTTSLNNGTIVLSSSGATEYSLYASWDEHEYSFNYLAGYKETSDSEIEYITESVTFNNTLNTFTISDFVDEVLVITTTATYSTCKFYGWYVGIDTTLNIQISSITTSQLETFVSSYGDTVPLFCYFSNIITYEIVYVVNNDEITDSANANVDQGNAIPFPNEGNSEYDDYDNDPLKQKYFYGWYADSSLTIPVESSQPVEAYASGSEITTITLYGKWENKEEVYFKYNDTIMTRYVKPGGTIYNLNNITFEPFNDETGEINVGDYFQEYSFNSWYYNGNKYTSYTHTIGEDSVTFTASYDIVIYIYVTVTSLSNVSSITINGNGCNVNESIRIDIDNTQKNVFSGIDPTTVSDVNVTVVVVPDKSKVSVTFKTKSGSQTSSTESSTFQAAGCSEVSASSSCFAEGTLISMADGSQKPIEQINVGDLIMVWDFQEGKMEAFPVVLKWYHGTTNYELINLLFSNGKKVEVINCHCFFDLDTNKFESISGANYDEYIGHRFAFWNGVEYSAVTLDSVIITKETVGSYSLETAYYGNAIAEGFLTLTPQDAPNIFEFFEVGKDLKYDQEKMENDIEKYGLYTYDDWSEYLTPEQFELFNGKYYKILVGKGIITEEDIIRLIIEWV